MGLLKIEPALMLLLGLHIVEIKENRSPVEVPPIRLRVTLLANLVSEQAVQLRKRTSTSSTTPANAQNETSGWCEKLISQPSEWLCEEPSHW